MTNQKEQLKEELGIYHPGTWFMFPVDFNRILPPGPALLLAFFINKLFIKTEVDEVKNKWFQCSPDEVAGRLFFTHHQQERMTKQLKDNGIINCENRGRPKKRWIKINISHMKEQIKKHFHTPAKVRASLPAKVRAYDNDSLYIKNINKRTGPTTEDGTGKKATQVIKLHPRWKKFSIQLSTAIQIIRKVNKTSNIKTWPAQFRLLHIKEGVSIPRIRKVLNWYCKQIPDRNKWVPHVQSASSFRQKFFRVEGAMEREEPTKEETPGKSRKVKVPKGNENNLKLIQGEFFAAGLWTQTLRNELPELYSAMGNFLTLTLAKFKMIIKDKDPMRGGGPRGREFFQAEDFSDRNCNLSRVMDTYAKYMIKSVKGWPSWGGSLKKFFPGEAHFKRYWNDTAKHQGYTWCKAIKEILFETK